MSLDGSQVVAVKDLGLDYNVFQLIAKGLSVDNIRLDKPVIYLRREGDTWSLSRLVKTSGAGGRSHGSRKARLHRRDRHQRRLDRARRTGRHVGCRRCLNASIISTRKLSFKYEPVRYSIEIAHVSFRGSDPAIALKALSGGVSVRDDTVYVDKLSLRTSETSLSIDGAVQHYLTTPSFNLHISSDKLTLPEIARLVPALAGVKLQPAVELQVAGTVDRLGVEMNAQSSAGGLYGKLTADLQAPGQSVTGTVSVRHLNLAPILNDPAQRSDITADARVNLHGKALSNVSALKGTLALTSPRIVAAGYTAGPLEAKARIDGFRVSLDARAVAYGASATANGHVTLPDTTKRSKSPIAFDLRGRASHVDLRNLPRDLKVPSADTNLNANYHVSGSVGPTDLRGELQFQPSTVAGARIAEGSTAGFTVNGKAIGYTADATFSNLDLERAGQAFDVPALADERYKSDINGHVIASGRGTALPALDLTASGALADTTIAGSQIPQLNFEAIVAADTVHVKAKGTFAGFDPAVVSGKPELKGTVAGALDVDATVAHVSTGVTPDGVQARANVTLKPSTIGGLEIVRASLDGDYHDSTADIRTLDIVGRDINAQVSGMLALNETGQSNLKLHADSPSLTEIGKLVNQPLAGIAKVDATVTGNRRELQATGNLTGSAVKYGDNGALSVSTDYSAKVPELRAADASVVATSHATFVTVGGQNINELDAKTTYNQKEVEFEAAAKQPTRSLTTTGSLTLHPDHQEIHLRGLALTSQGVQWRVSSGR